MTPKKVGEIRTLYTGKIFTLKECDIVFPDGEKKVYEFCQRPNSVSTLAFNEKGEILLIKEKRFGHKKDTWFLPSGRVEPGEDPKKAAIREMREESGYRPKRIRKLYTKSPSNTLLWDIFIFVAKDLIFDPLPQDKGESIKAHFVPFKKAVTMALDGTIDNEFISYSIIRFDYMIKHGQFQW